MKRSQGKAGLYYHPEALRDINATLQSAPHYNAVVEFICAFERLVPQSLVDLKRNVLPLLTSDVTKAIDVERSNTPEHKEIDIVLQSSKQPVLFFANALMAWAKEYKLFTDNHLYLDIAYRALSSRVWNQRVANMFQSGLSKAFGFSFTENESDERISLLDGVRLDSKDALFDQAFPFVFTPSRTKMQSLDTPKLELNNPAPYESLYSHSNKIGYAVSNVNQGKMDADKLFELGNPYWRGIAWDPTSGEKWEEFERKMDETYEAYKTAYKARAMAAIKSLGIQETTQKEALYHFEWLVLNRVYGKKHREIANYHMDQTGEVIGEDAIQKQLKPLLKMTLLS